MKKRRKGQISEFGISKRIQQFCLPGQGGRKILLARQLRMGAQKISVECGDTWRFIWWAGRY